MNDTYHYKHSQRAYEKAIEVLRNVKDEKRVKRRDDLLGDAMVGIAGCMRREDAPTYLQESIEELPDNFNLRKEACRFFGKRIDFESVQKLVLELPLEDARDWRRIRVCT